MPSLSAWFENLLLSSGLRVITVIGSGGKTSLIWHLAAYLAAQRKILVTPTTKMFPPPDDPVPGISLAGILNERSGKLESLPLDQLEKIIPAYDLVLIEGDGSHLLPLKAWARDEPVVPAFTGLTIGMLPLWPLGKPVTENLVHRLPIFLTLTGAAQGELLKPEHIQRLITGRQSGETFIPGLFAKARGKKLLFFNQIEDDASLKQARELTESLPLEFRSGLCGIIAGSVQEDMVEELLLSDLSIM